MTNVYNNNEIDIIRFFNKFENLNSERRRLVASEYGNSLYSWNVVFLELINKTKLSRKLLKEMSDNNFITRTRVE